VTGPPTHPADAPPGTTPAPGTDPETVRPRYGEDSLSEVLPGVVTALARTQPTGPDPLGLATGPLAGARAVVVLLIDGLGHHNLPPAAPVAPRLLALVDGGHPGASYRAITAGFPSTTPTSLVSLGTGVAPGAHGVLGFTVRIPGTDRRLTHTDWRDDPDPARWQPVPTQFQRAAAAGVAATVVSRAQYAGSGLTRAAYGGAGYVLADDVAAIAPRVIAELAAATGPTLIYAYHPEVDTAGHRYGLQSPEWAAAVADVDALVARLVDGLPADCALVITADHGQLDVPAERRFDIGADRRLGAGVRVVAGEPRVRYLHVEPGAAADVCATWRGVLGDAAWVAERDEVIGAGWYGPMTARHAERVGDVVVMCRADHAVLAGGHEPDRVARLFAFHGSATPAEMMVPLLVVRADQR
jgi:hypothetical protein